MKSVMLSIQPKYCELIASGKKTVEVKKTRPKIETPFKCYIYQTKKTWLYDIYNIIADWQGKVIGEFVCDEIEILRRNTIFNAPALYSQSCLTRKEYFDYIGNKTAYIWHISDLVIYDKPKELDYFRKPIDCHRGKDRYDCVGCWDCEITRPLQSWCYVEE